MGGAGFDLDAGRLAPAAADELLRRWGVTHALIACDSKAARSFSRWRVERRTGNYCVLTR